MKVGALNRFFFGRILLGALFLCLLGSVPAFGRDELLEPEAAFRLSAKLVDEHTVRVRYDIADGYYMYRDRFSFAATPAPVKLGAALLPAGTVKQDQFFGNVVVYRGALVIDLPLRSSLTSEGLTLKVVSQGCADIGVCYTPLTQTAKLMPAVHSEGGLSSSGKRPGLLKRLQADAEAVEEFLPVDKAFHIEVHSASAKTLVAQLSPAENYYLYRDKIRFTIAPGTAATIESVRLPRGESKQDPNFGNTEVFHSPVQAEIDLRGRGPHETALLLQVHFQGCSEKGLCYPPAMREVPVSFAAVSQDRLTKRTAPEQLRPGEGQVQQPSEDRQIAGLMKTENFWLVMASFLGFGLLLSFTPCVLPMIPILSGLIAGQGKKATRWRGFTLSATYVLGMAIAYAIAGVLAGLSGNLLTSALQTPWVLGAFAAIFVILAFSMFGFYQLQLPVAWQTSAADTSNRLTRGTLAGVFGMGALSAVIVGPCVAAPLAGALLYVSQSRDVILGGSALFMMAVGMGLPLLVIGASAGALLPKAGAWMQAVKNFFGVLLIAAALWIISPVVSTTIQMACWSALMIISSIYLHAIDPLPAGAGNLRKLGKGLGVIALLLGIALLIGVLSGSRDIFRPLSGWQIQSGEPKSAQPLFIPVSSIAQLDRLLEQPGKPVLLDFYADWCVSCKEMEKFTFQDDSVKSRLANMTLLRADVTANTAADSALLKKFHLYGPPGMIFFDRQGAEIKDVRVIGYLSAERFLPILDNVDNSN